MSLKKVCNRDYKCDFEGTLTNNQLPVDSTMVDISWAGTWAKNCASNFTLYDRRTIVFSYFRIFGNQVRMFTVIKRHGFVVLLLPEFDWITNPIGRGVPRPTTMYILLFLIEF